MEQQYFPDKTNDFNLRLEDESGKNWRKAAGVISVELPKITVGRGRSLLGIAPVRIFFASVEDALAVAGAEETHLRVRAAEQLFNMDGKCVFKGREHIITIERGKSWLSPGVAKRGEHAYAMCEFQVKRYAMTFDGEEIFCASAEDKEIHIK